MTGVNLARISGNGLGEMPEITGEAVVATTRQCFETLALPRSRHDNKQSARSRAARECHLSERQAKRLLEGDLEDVKGSVFLNVLLRFVAFQEEITKWADDGLEKSLVRKLFQAMEPTHGDSTICDDGVEGGEGGARGGMHETWP